MKTIDETEHKIFLPGIVQSTSYFESKSAHNKVQLESTTMLTLRKNHNKKRWQLAEKEAVERQLGLDIVNRKVPGISASTECLNNEPVLQNSKRSWKDIKFYVYNKVCGLRQRDKVHMYQKHYHHILFARNSSNLHNLSVSKSSNLTS